MYVVVLQCSFTVLVVLYQKCRLCLVVHSSSSSLYMNSSRSVRAFSTAVLRKHNENNIEYRTATCRESRLVGGWPVGCFSTKLLNVYLNSGKPTRALEPGPYHYHEQGFRSWKSWNVMEIMEFKKGSLKCPYHQHFYFPIWSYISCNELLWKKFSIWIKSDFFMNF